MTRAAYNRSRGTPSADGPSSKPLTFGVPHARFVSVGLFSEPSRRSQQAKGIGKLPKPLRKCRALIGNEMHSPASASPVPAVTSIFSIGNEFQFARREFRGRFSDDRRAQRTAPLRRSEAKRRQAAALQKDTPRSQHKTSMGHPAGSSLVTSHSSLDFLIEFLWEIRN